MNITRKTKILLALALGLLVLVVGAGAAWVAHKRRQRPLTPEQAFAAGTKHFEEKRYQAAFQHLGYAARERPQDAEYNRAAARVAIEAGQPKAAAPYLEAAWDNGLRTAEVLSGLSAGVEFDTPAQRLKKALEWFGELPESERSDELEADLRYAGGEREKALGLWERAFKTGPSSPLANKIVRAHIELRQSAAALKFLKELAGTPSLDEEGYGWYGTLLALANRPEEAEKIFTEGRDRFPEGEKLRIREADYLMTRDRPAEAAAVLEPLQERSENHEVELRHHRARLYLGALHALQGAEEKLAELERLAEGDRPWLEGERLFYEGVTRLIRRDPQAIERIEQARKLIPSHPAVEMIYADTLAANRRWADAASVYRAIEGVLGRAPRVLLSLAQAFHRSGQTDEALQTLGRLHARRVYSKASLELFRNLAFQKNLTKEGTAAQQLLESRFKDDPGVRLTGGLLAIREGRLNEAAALLDALAESHPEREDVETARLSVILARKDYEGLLRECGKSSASPEKLAPMQARALVQLGRTSEALALLRKTAESHPVPAVRLPLASLLLGTGDLAEAEPHIAAVLRSAPSNGPARIGAALIALRQGRLPEARTHVEAVTSSGESVPYAHLLLAEIELLQGHPQQALDAAHRVLAGAPDHSKARLLRAIAAIALGRLEDAERALDRLIEKHPDSANVRFHLARARLLRGRPKEALALVDAALARPAIAGSPAALPLSQFRVVLLGQEGKPAEASALLESIGDRLSVPVKASLQARLLEREGKLAEAVTVLRPHLDTRSLAIQWAILSLRLGRSAGVIEAVAPHAPDLATWIRLAAIAGEHELTPISAEAYRRALRLDPENPRLLNNYAWNAMQSASYDREDVLSAARKAHTQLPTNPSVIHTYATALLKADRLRDCIDLLDRDPTSTRKAAKLLLVLARAHEARKEFPRAVEIYTECLNHSDTADVKEGDLSRPALRKRIESLSGR